MVRLRGFSLIESIIVIVVMGLAMLTITRFLVPQIASSAEPHYQTRAAALGQSVMTQILARQFAQNSGTQGGFPRCSSSDPGAQRCTSRQGIDSAAGETAINPNIYNDVDDFTGCWEPQATNGCRDLNLLVKSSAYTNFRLEVDVTHHDISDVNRIKQIKLTVSAANQTPIEFYAYRGNY